MFFLQICIEQGIWYGCYGGAVRSSIKRFTVIWKACGLHLWSMYIYTHKELFCFTLNEAHHDKWCPSHLHVRAQHLIRSSIITHNDRRTTCDCEGHPAMVSLLLWLWLHFFVCPYCMLLCGTSLITALVGPAVCVCVCKQQSNKSRCNLRTHIFTCRYHKIAS